MINKETTALLDEWRVPSCCSESDLRAQVAPLLDLVSSARKQTALVRQLMLAAEMADDSGKLAGLFERQHQKCDAVDGRAGDVTKGIRELRISLEQMTQIGAEIEASIADLHAQAQAAAAEPTP